MDEFIIERVDQGEYGWLVSSNGMAVVVPQGSPVIPEVGMHLIVYGEGPGTPVRGLVLNGVTVFYLTPDEQAVWRDRKRHN